MVVSIIGISYYALLFPSQTTQTRGVRVTYEVSPEDSESSLEDPSTQISFK